MADEKITVSTNIHSDGRIVQTVDSLGHAMTWIVETREKQIREALIALGWTPPKDD